MAGVTTWLLYLAPLVRDLVIMVNFWIEGSFTGSAGTTYNYEDGVLRNVGGFLFVWLCVNVGISFLWNAWRFAYKEPFDLTSLMLYIFALSAVFSYAHFTNQDYRELDGRDIGFWNTLNNIKTLGNQPEASPSAEAVSWALTEMFMYTLVVIDFVHCLGQHPLRARSEKGEPEEGKTLLGI